MGRRGLWGGMLGVVAGMILAVPAPASAHTVSCEFVGQLDAGVQWIGGTGTYELREFEAPCQVLRDGQTIPDVLILDILSRGTFTNVECGTGTFTDADPVVNATVISGSVDAEALVESANLSYSISFNNTRGIVTWSVQAPLPPGVGGVAAIQPEHMGGGLPTGNPVNQTGGHCGELFNVEAVFGFEM